MTKVLKKHEDRNKSEYKYAVKSSSNSNSNLKTTVDAGKVQKQLITETSYVSVLISSTYFSSWKYHDELDGTFV